MKQKGYNDVVSSNGNSLAQKFKTYQGQELTEDLGLNWHEWKYRMSDPAIGRFISIDPLAEDYAYNSTYAFQENKLGMGIELEGAELLSWGDMAAIYADAGANPNGVGAHTVGLAQGTVNAGKGIVSAVSNPGRTISALGDMASPLPNSTKIQMAVGVANDADAVVNGNGFERGEVIGRYGADALIGKGAGEAIGQASNLLNKVDNIAGVSPNVQKALNTLDEIKADGGQVKMNDLQSATSQELNMTVTQGTNKLDVRVETHTVPKKFGGNGQTPQRHLNVDLYPKKTSPLPNKGHKILKDQ